jgi:hypothetical protein
MAAPQKDLEYAQVRFRDSDEASVPDHERLDVHLARIEAILAASDRSIPETPALELRTVKELFPDFDQSWVFPQQNVGTRFTADIGIHPLSVEVTQFLGAFGGKDDRATF